ncbi:DNA polymerase III subunit gamma/tau [Bacteroidota bacterium]
MQYLVTARKWRPQTFEEVVGQEHITKTLKNAILNNRIAHAYLFSGPRGIGKTTTARILAKSLNCTNPQKGEPCNECDMCKSFQSSQTMDIIEIDGASNRRIEEIRALRESVKYAPTKGQYKIYIIDEVHMLTTESFNALLKTLEEPPSHTLFIFATTDIHKVPLTIISRCQRFDFRRIEMHDIKAHLKKIAESEKIKIDDQSLTLISKKADGALRDAQSLFDQVISFCDNKIEVSVVSQMLNIIDEEIYFEISDAIVAKNFNSAFEVSKRIYQNGWNFIDFVNGLVEHFRNVMTVILTKDNKLIETAEVFLDRYLKYANSFSEGDMLRILSFLNKVQYELKSASNQKLKIEISLLQLIGLEKSSTITEVLSQIKLSPQNPEIKETIGFQQQTNQSSPAMEVKSADTSIPNISNKEKPKIESFKAPSLEQGLTLESISAKWSDFLEQVNSEKFWLGSLLAQAKLENIDGEKVNLKVEHLDDCKIIDENKKYFFDKTKEIFGAKLEFHFTNGKSHPGVNKNKAETKDAKSTSPQNSESSQNSDLVNAIINELGGKEIK